MIIDKSTWADGPWKSEPDHLEWQHAGFACELQRHPELGAWWGWVFLERDHPLYGQSLAGFEDLSVHGGVNVVKKLHDDRFMVSFDCAHVFDTAPAIDAKLEALGAPENTPRRSMETYRTFVYAKEQVESLAEQLRVLADA
jgi:hypothetical protein